MLGGEKKNQCISGFGVEQKKALSFALAILKRYTAKIGHWFNSHCLMRLIFIFFQFGGKSTVSSSSMGLGSVVAM